VCDFNDLKNNFIFDEIFQASINASFSTRNPNYPIYNKNIIKPKTLNCELKGLIKAYLVEFQNDEINEERHFREIENIAHTISTNKKYFGLLHESRFRIGIAQKLLNLTLKYLWCIDKVKEPLHCPIDSIVISKIQPQISNTIWTKLDSMDEYRICINAIKTIANKKNMSIAQWELDIWNRRSV
jgi:hypothetical protein